MLQCRTGFDAQKQQQKTFYNTTKPLSGLLLVLLNIKQGGKWSILTPPTISWNSFIRHFNEKNKLFLDKTLTALSPLFNLTPCAASNSRTRIQRLWLCELGADEVQTNQTACSRRCYFCASHPEWESVRGLRPDSLFPLRVSPLCLQTPLNFWPLSRLRL